MLYQISVKTPRNQAAKCMKTQREALLGLRLSSKVLKEDVVAHNEFYWVLDLKDLKDIQKLSYNCAKGEIIIKKFYQTLFKLFHRAHQLCIKFGAGMIWGKKWIYKQLNKKFEDTRSVRDYIDSMNDKEFSEFFNITDKDDIQNLISGNIITVKELNPKGSD